MDINKHRSYLTQVLLDIFQDKGLSSLLAFKGGTSLMMFHGLPRFSTDLDFNLLNTDEIENVFHRIHNLVLRYGTIDDEAIKHFGAILVLNYEKSERMLKIEISSRMFPNHYEIRSLLGTDIRVMTIPDMFAHKLCALGERITPRDIYDVWFFLKKRTEINSEIVELRTGKKVEEFSLQCANQVRNYNPRILMQGLGDVLQDTASKNFVRQKLLSETATGLELFSMYPLCATF
ncbi:MAG: nucleotidyl transferase AbiEii/AbiGii toxin family protein [Bacteroidales bacterium]|nr:nucleotidyl transferase AbiEii/AbiGii toxin family protein [Bacteroidales bacterium]